MASGGITIRPATEGDLDWLICQLKSFSSYFGTKKSLFGDEEFARAGMQTMLTSHLVLIAESVIDGPVGFIAGVVTPHLFNPQIRVLAETFWWVAESRRGSRASLLLLEEFIKWGKANADWVTFALEHRTPVKESSLIRRGFHLQEKSFLLEVV